MSAPRTRSAWLASVAALFTITIIVVTLHAAMTYPQRGATPAAGDAAASKSTSAILPPARELVIYCGRAESLVGNVIDRFRHETGIDVKVKYGGTGTLAGLILEEGRRSPADVFFAQDPGGLGLLAESGRLRTLPSELLTSVPSTLRDSNNRWVGVTGRLRTLAYATDRIDAGELPQSLLELTDAKWRGRVGWAPANASFQAMVTAMRHELGEAATEKWLRDMISAGVRAYPRNTPILQAIHDREIDLGLVNHYYLHRFQKERSGAMMIANHIPAGADRLGDIGGALLVSGVAVLDTARNTDEATLFIEFLLSDSIQSYFAEETFEYPLAENSQTGRNPFDMDTLPIRNVDLNQLGDLDATIRLLRRTGALR